MKANKTISMDSDLIDKGKSLGLNFSEEINNFIRIKLNYTYAKSYENLVEVTQKITMLQKKIDTQLIEKQNLEHQKIVIQSEIEKVEAEQMKKEKQEAEKKITCLLCEQITEGKNLIRLFGAKICNNCFQGTASDEIKDLITKKLKNQIEE